MQPSPKSHLKYLAYVMRHKYYLVDGWSYIGGFSVWRALKHDWSKFSLSEWTPYVEKFFGSGESKSDEQFERAWLHHFHLNDHHPQHYINLKTSSGITQPVVLNMPSECVHEMVADWYAAGMAQGKPDVVSWYKVAGHNIPLGDATRIKAESLLQYLPEARWLDRRGIFEHTLNALYLSYLVIRSMALELLCICLMCGIRKLGKR